MKKTNWFKRIFFAIFGKARWFVLGLVAVALVFTVTTVFDPSYTHLYQIADSLKGDYYVADEYKDADFSKDGNALLSFNRYNQNVVGLTNINTGEQYFSDIPYAPTDSGYITTFNFVAGDNDTIYAVCTKFDRSMDDTVATDEYVMAFHGSFNNSETLCKIHYDYADRARNSRLTKLYYSDGELKFAKLDMNQMQMYSIDTKTGNVRISDPYLPDENENYTTYATAIEDSFLVVQSDGNVYRVGFNEPLTTPVYKVEAGLENPNTDAFFNLAVLVNGRIYLAKRNDNGKVFLLENGKITEALDLSDNGSILSLCAVTEGNKEVLTVSCSGGIFTYDGNDVTKKEIPIFVRNHVLVYIDIFLSLMIYVCVFGLIINLIIRKKTLLFKQIAITVPILVIASVLVSTSLYISIQEDNVDKSSSDVDIVCRIATSAFDGYDFSGWEELDEDTGKASRAILKRFDEFDTDKGKFNYTLLYRYDDVHAVVLADSEAMVQPYAGKGIFGPLADENYDGSDFYMVKDVSGIFSSENRSSTIAVYGQIHDKNNTGKYYLKVQTDDWSFWSSRRDLFLKVFVFIAIIIAILTLITVVTSLYISRTIKKATKTVKSIADGDFSARVKYRSKDELGEICSQVNTMANSLETMFDEKDKTEKFYYKFVPEKFRELLGKEQFTDLALGDAASRDLSVLFFDIRSFSINSEIMTAKENFEFVNVIYGKAGPIIRKYNGFVDKYIGDAVMALFEDAESAIRCGIELYKEIVLNPETAKEIGIGDINIGIGIHSGMAQIGIVGEEERLSGTVISDTVNISSRLESLTKQYKTAMLITKDTVDRMKDPEALNLRYLGEIQVAGVNEVKALYEVLDCLDDEEKNKRSANNKEFREAVRLFHLGRRKEAAEALQALNESGRGDHVTKMYFDFICSLSREEKANVFRFVRK